MATFSTADERRRKSRNILFSAFVALLIIWTVKLCFPQHTVLSVYETHRTGSNPASPIISQGASTSAAAVAAPVQSGVWQTRPDAPIKEDLVGVNGTSPTKAAVIVETRFRTNLIPLILHFGSVLGQSWPIFIYTSPESVGQFAASAALARYIKSGTIEIRILPQTVLFTNSDSVNAFMTQKWLWESLAPAENILIFQSDSMLCANAARSVDDYFAYDFVGAPIAAGKGNGYNGGLSLRKRSTTLRILEEWDWEKTKKEGDRFEDQWYYNRMKDLQNEEQAEGIDPTEDGAINLPSMEVARTFSVETIDYPHPLGVHQVHRWLKTQILSLDEWCPEYKLCSSEFIKDG